MKKATTTVALLLVVVWTFQCTGCFSTARPRASLDDDLPLAPGQRIISNWDFAAVKPGTKTELALFSGQKLSGRFRGLQPVSDDVYKERYARSRGEASPGLELPALGEPLTIVDSAGNVHESEFIGFDRGLLYGRLRDNAEPVRFNLKMVKAIRASGEKNIPLGPLIAFISKGRVPFRSALRLDLPKGKITVPLEEISRVLVNESRGPGAKIILLVVGAAAVVGLAVAIVSTSKEQTADWLIEPFSPR